MTYFKCLNNNAAVWTVDPDQALYFPNNETGGFFAFNLARDGFSAPQIGYRELKTHTTEKDVCIIGVNKIGKPYG